ncbi:MAG: hypothetical protein LBJ41_01325 [Treponema sp.]|jgi:hypothetical protein|nr:hypothetical protein [Treponema sp.]
MSHSDGRMPPPETVQVRCGFSTTCGRLLFYQGNHLGLCPIDYGILALAITVTTIPAMLVFITQQHTFAAGIHGVSFLTFTLWNFAMKYYKWLDEVRPPVRPGKAPVLRRHGLTEYAPLALWLVMA